MARRDMTRSVVSRARFEPASPKLAKRARRADVAQLAERVLGKDEVTSSILVIGSTEEDTHGVVR